MSLIATVGLAVMIAWYAVFWIVAASAGKWDKSRNYTPTVLLLGGLVGLLFLFLVWVR